MKVRIALAALLGGLTLFAWGAFSHLVLGLGDGSVRTAPAPPGDQALLDALKTTLPEKGLYLFPGMDPARANDPEAMAEWEDRTETNPHGLIVYNVAPYGGMQGQLIRELLINVGAAFLAAVLLSWTLGCCKGLAGRTAFVTLLGLLVAFRPVQQWNWYEFPLSYTLEQVADGVLGFLAMGVVIALIVKPKPEMGSGVVVSPQ